MSFRLAMAVVGATTAGIGGIAAKNGALQEYGIDPAIFDPAAFTSLSDFDMDAWGPWKKDMPASVTGSKGAKFVSLDPDKPARSLSSDTPKTSFRDQLIDALRLRGDTSPEETADNVEKMMQQMGQTPDMPANLPDDGFKEQLKKVIGQTTLPD